jgi:selenoprotein W-related protein
VWLDGKLLWSRKEHGRFPDIKELKQLVRDEVAPELGLGIAMPSPFNQSKS